MQKTAEQLWNEMENLKKLQRDLKSLKVSYDLYSENSSEYAQNLKNTKQNDIVNGLKKLYNMEPEKFLSENVKTVDEVKFEMYDEFVAKIPAMLAILEKQQQEQMQAEQQKEKVLTYENFVKQYDEKEALDALDYKISLIDNYLNKKKSYNDTKKAKFTPEELHETNEMSEFCKSEGINNTDKSLMRKMKELKAQKETVNAELAKMEPFIGYNDSWVQKKTEEFARTRKEKANSSKNTVGEVTKTTLLQRVLNFFATPFVVIANLFKKTPASIPVAIPIDDNEKTDKSNHIVDNVNAALINEHMENKDNINNAVNGRQNIWAIEGEDYNTSRDTIYAGNVKIITKEECETLMQNNEDQKVPVAEPVSVTHF